MNDEQKTILMNVVSQCASIVDDSYAKIREAEINADLTDPGA